MFMDEVGRPLPVLLILLRLQGLQGEAPLSRLLRTTVNLSMAEGGVNRVKFIEGIIMHNPNP